MYLLAAPEGFSRWIGTREGCCKEATMEPAGMAGSPCGGQLTIACLPKGGQALFFMRNGCAGLRDRPVDFRLSLCLQVAVAAGKMPVAQEPAVCGKRRGMRRRQDTVFLRVDDGTFFLGITAP